MTNGTMRAIRAIVMRLGQLSQVMVELRITNYKLRMTDVASRRFIRRALAIRNWSFVIFPRIAVLPPQSTARMPRRRSYALGRRNGQWPRTRWEAPARDARRRDGESPVRVSSPRRNE